MPYLTIFHLMDNLKKSPTDQSIIDEIRGYFQKNSDKLMKDVNNADIYDFHPVLYAANSFNVKVLELIVQLNPDLLKVRIDGKEVSLLFYISTRIKPGPGEKESYFQMFEFLVKNIARRDEIMLLGLAAYVGYLDGVKYALEKFQTDIDHKDDRGCTALMNAVQNQHVDIVKDLLSKGASVRGRDIKKVSALMRAVHKNNLEIINLLLNHEMSLDDEDLKDAAKIAKRNNYQQAVQLLESYIIKRKQDQIIKAQYDLFSYVSSYNQEDIEKVKEILALEGIDVKNLRLDGRTVLMQAAQSGSIAVVNLLLDEGLNIDDVDNNGKTPFMIAAENGFAKVVELLFSRGANIKHVDNYGQNALMLAAGNGYYVVCKFLLERNLELLGDKDGYDRDPLMIAVQSSNRDIVNLMITYGATVNNRQRGNLSPLFIAVEQGDVDIAKLLLQNGAQIDEIDKEGNTVLSIAINKKDFSMIKLLEKYTPQITEINLPEIQLANDDNQQGQPLVIDLTGDEPQKQQHEIIDLTLDEDIPQNQQVNKPTQELLEKAQLDLFRLIEDNSEDSINKIKEILNLSGIDVNRPDDESFTPLMRVAITGNVKIINLLITKGVNLDLQNDYKCTALILAISEGKFEAAKILLQNGADVEISQIEEWTPLMFAAKDGNLKIATLILAKMNNIDAKNIHGDTALTLAVENGHVGMVKLLIPKSKAVDEPDEKGNTLLMTAVKKKRKDIVEPLLEKYENINQRDKDGATALIIAVADHSTKIVKLLLEQNVDINIKNKHGFSALDIALHYDYQDIVQMLLNKQNEINKRLQLSTAGLGPAKKGQAESDQIEEQDSPTGIMIDQDNKFLFNNGATNQKKKRLTPDGVAKGDISKKKVKQLGLERDRNLL